MNANPLCAVLCLILTLPATAKLRHEAGKDGQLPQGLRLVDWTQIQAEYQRHRHAAFPDANGLHARSFEQQWLSHFDGRGFTRPAAGRQWVLGWFRNILHFLR